MPTPLPTSYDWSSTQAPSGPFGVETIPGSESVLGNLTGLGALGTNGILNFANGFGSSGFNLSNLSRFAGSLGNLLGPGFDMAASTKELEDMAKKTTKQIDLGISPDIAAEYDRLGSRVDNIQNQYSLAGRLGGYEKLALEPPVVSMDVSSIRKAADWASPEIASQFGMMTDYSGPQASRFIYGGNRTADAIGKYYNTSGDVAGLMNYGTLA
jgi:hypothetical protein